MSIRCVKLVTKIVFLYQHPSLYLGCDLGRGSAANEMHISNSAILKCFVMTTDKNALQVVATREPVETVRNIGWLR